MKYRTVIELICEASNEEDAINTAGEYLRGDVDYGVEMVCKTATLRTHKVKKYAAFSIVTIMVFSSLLFKGVAIGGDEKIQSSVQPGIRSTYTIMPALKTKHRSDFKKEWVKKKEEAVLEYIKQ